MKKRNLTLFMLIPGLLLSGCGKREIKYDTKTINVKLLLGGYGTEWLTKLIDTFENTYKDLGYKVNLMTPNKQNIGNNVRVDLMSGFDKKKVDLYFTGSLDPALIGGGKDGVLALALDDLVFNQKALRFDGTEEEKTVAEKLDPSFTDEWYKYDGKAYNFFYQRSIGGLVVNYDKLQNCGFNELPVTSDQFMDMIHQIRLNESKTRPFSYVAKTGYANAGFQVWFTQLAGIDKWYKFHSMNKDNGEFDLENGKEVFNFPELDDAGAKVFEMFDSNNLASNALNFSISQGHSSLMLSRNERGSVFLFDGDWALNETRDDFPTDEELSVLRFINTPINSSLGTKLWGPGTEANITDAKVVDNILAKVALMSDEAKEISEIKTAIQSEFGKTLSDNSILEACKARGIYFNRGLETGTACVPVGITDEHKDIVGKFLRTMASEDFAKMYFKTGKCFSPYSSSVDDNETLLPFFEGHKKIATHKYANGILSKMSGLRKTIGSSLDAFFPNIPNGYYHDIALESSQSAYNATVTQFVEANKHVYLDQAEALSQAAYQLASSAWNEWTKNL